jgi:hypothetical protein
METEEVTSQIEFPRETDYTTDIDHQDAKGVI